MKCLDLRDKIYVLLGIAAQGSTSEVGYSKTNAEIYTDLVSPKINHILDYASRSPDSSDYAHIWSTFEDQRYYVKAQVMETSNSGDLWQFLQHLYPFTT